MLTRDLLCQSGLQSDTLVSFTDAINRVVFIASGTLCRTTACNTRRSSLQSRSRARMAGVFQEMSFGLSMEGSE